MRSTRVDVAPPQSALAKHHHRSVSAAGAGAEGGRLPPDALARLFELQARAGGGDFDAMADPLIAR